MLTEPPPIRPDAERLEEARQLRVFSNELLRMTAEFLAKAPVEAKSRPGEYIAFHRWSERSLLPRLKDLQRRMLAERISCDAFYELRKANDRTIAMASSPDDPRIRKHAADSVLAACSMAETRISDMHVASFVTPPPLMPGFKAMNKKR